MTRADDPERAATGAGALPSVDDLLAELEVAKRGDDDRLLILIGSQLLARDELTPAQQLDVLNVRSRARYRSSHFAAAADDWTRVRELHPEDHSALFNLGACAYGTGQYEAALDDFMAAEAQSGAAATADDLIWRSSCRYHLGDIAGARKDFQAASALEPDNLTVWRWRANISDPDGDDLQTSLEEVDLAMGVLRDGSLRHRRARILVALQRPAEAVAELDALLHETPEAGEILVYRAKIKEGAGDWAGALADLAELIGRSSDHVLAQEANIALLRRLGRGEDALAAADRFAETSSHWSGPQRLRGEILEELGDTARAAAAFKTAWDISPWERQSGYRSAVLLRETGDITGALEILVVLDRQYFTPPVALTMAQVLVALDQPREALKQLDKMIDWDAKDAAAYRARAAIRRSVGRIKEARIDLDWAVMLEKHAAKES
jgi:tetratricopeptide (TPR) repeat protein